MNERIQSSIKPSLKIPFTGLLSNMSHLPNEIGMIMTVLIFLCDYRHYPKLDFLWLWLKKIKYNDDSRSQSCTRPRSRSYLEQDMIDESFDEDSNELSWGQFVSLVDDQRVTPVQNAQWIIRLNCHSRTCQKFKPNNKILHFWYTLVMWCCRDIVNNLHFVHMYKYIIELINLIREI